MKLLDRIKKPIRIIVDPIKEYPKSIAKYISSVTSIYSWLRIAQFSLIVSLILLVVDFYNIPSVFIKKIPTALFAICTVLLIAFFYFWIRSSRVLELRKIVIICEFDYLILVCFFGLTIYGAARVVGIRAFCVPLLVSIVLVWLIIVVFLIMRITTISKRSRKTNVTGNIVDFKEVVTGSIKPSNSRLILVSETDSRSDLLDRQFLVDEVVTSINSAISDQSFAIGIIGTWGSGKTTVLENVKSSLKQTEDSFDIIDDFDPWLFGNQESLLLAMLDAILKCTGVRYSPLKSKKMMEQICTTLSEKYYTSNILNALNLQSGTKENVIILKNQISDYLNYSDRRIVFFIDNIDRTSSENIVFLFKLLGTAFNIPRIIYVLAYDESRIQEAFSETKEIDNHYIDKIVQQEIRIPEITKEQKKQLFSIAFENLLHAYGIQYETLINLMAVINLIVSRVNDLRQFKRLINSVVSPVLYQEKHLYIPDLLAIETIRFLEPEIYEQIYRKRQYFISDDKMVDYDIMKETIRKKDFNEKGKHFFSKMFEGKTELKNCLGELFPYVRRFNNETDLIDDYYTPDGNYSKVQQDMRICSAKFFDLYFNHGNNAFKTISIGIDEFIQGLQEESASEIRKSLQEQIVLFRNDVKLWMETLYYKIDKIAKNGALFAHALYEIIYDLDDSTQFLSLSARERAIVIITELLAKSSDEDFDVFVSTLNCNYEKTIIIGKLVYWINNVRASKEPYLEKRQKIISDLYTNICRDIVEKRINIFADQYYHMYNTYALYEYCKEVDPDLFLNYISSVISPENVYRAIGDTVSLSISNQGYGYRINKETFLLYFGEGNIVEELMAKAPPKNDSERFLVTLYTRYRQNNEGIKENSFFFERPIDIKL